MNDIEQYHIAMENEPVSPKSKNKKTNNLRPTDFLNQYISQEPGDYFTEKTDVNPAALALFSFYEEQQSDIYQIIHNNDDAVLIPIDNEDPDVALLHIFAEGSGYNKDKICLKFKQEIQCVSTDPRVESYIIQSKKDWYRTPFFSSKYNRYYNKTAGLPYTDESPDVDKLFLITVAAINAYFMLPPYEPSLRIESGEAIDAHLGEIDCDCEKLPAHPLICAGFNTLQIPNANVKQILYNLSFVNQSQKSEIMLRFKHLMNAFQTHYDGLLGPDGFLDYNLGEGVGYSYLDSKNNAFVYINTLILVVVLPDGGVLYVPVYKVIQVYPIQLSEYYYTFLYVDNDPPATVHERTKWWQMNKQKQPSMPITSDYYGFLREKIGWYLQKYQQRPEDFENGRYKGADYLKYITAKATAFQKTHKPYVYEYKSRKFVEPDFSRLLGGTRQLSNKRKRVTRKRRLNKTKKQSKSKCKQSKSKRKQSKRKQSKSKRKQSKRKQSKRKQSKRKQSKHKVTQIF
jgi:hypothetical protein